MSLDRPPVSADDDLWKRQHSLQGSSCTWLHTCSWPVFSHAGATAVSSARNTPNPTQCGVDADESLESAHSNGHDGSWVQQGSLEFLECCVLILKARVWGKNCLKRKFRGWNNCAALARRFCSQSSGLGSGFGVLWCRCPGRPDAETHRPGPVLRFRRLAAAPPMSTCLSVLFFLFIFLMIYLFFHFYYYHFFYIRPVWTHLPRQWFGKVASTLPTQQQGDSPPIGWFWPRGSPTRQSQRSIVSPLLAFLSRYCWRRL